MDFATVFDAFERLGGQHAREVAEAYWLNPTVENRVKYLEACLPLYRSRSTVDQDALKRALINHDVAIRFNGPHNEFGRMDFRSDLKRIRCPVLILAGDRDPVMPMPFSETIAECLPRHLVRFERFAGCGHGLHLEEPERTFDVLRRFIMAEMQ